MSARNKEMPSYKLSPATPMKAPRMVRRKTGDSTGAALPASEVVVELADSSESSEVAVGSSSPSFLVVVAVVAVGLVVTVPLYPAATLVTTMLLVEVVEEVIFVAL